jgi:protoporphyrinogen oxidase
MKVAIIGAGIMGVSLGYFLSQAGLEVEIFEASPVLAGLAGPMTLEDGVEVDRFYHTILSSDSHLRQLCQELGIQEQFRFKKTGTGFYRAGQISFMNGLMDFLRFPPLNPLERLRLGLTVFYAQLVKDWQKLEKIRLGDWLSRVSGQGVYKKIWQPMLKAKFDGQFDDIPATWMWSRLVRTKSTRDGASQKEEAGHLIGGYKVLLEAMARKIERAGGKIHLKCPVQEVVIEAEATPGIRIQNKLYSFDAVVVTAQLPVFQRLIPGATPAYHDYLAKTDYLGIICPLLVLDRPLTGVWTLNIADDHVPFTGIIETTTYIDPKYVGGHHLVYVPKYTVPDSHWQAMPDAEIREIWLRHLEEMFPTFNRNSVRYFLVNRTRYVEPLHPLDSMHLIPAVKTPVEHLYLATTAQIYPALTNGESVTRHARQAAQTILEDIQQKTSSNLPEQMMIGS